MNNDAGPVGPAGHRLDRKENRSHVHPGHNHDAKDVADITEENVGAGKQVDEAGNKNYLHNESQTR